MDEKTHREVGRVAYRVEGDMWRVYYAQSDTMEGAIELASIRMTIVADPKIKAIFMSAMREIMTVVLEETVGATPDWTNPRTAPESERSGRA